MKIVSKFLFKDERFKMSKKYLLAQSIYTEKRCLLLTPESEYMNLRKKVKFQCKSCLKTDEGSTVLFRKRGGCKFCGSPEIYTFPKIKKIFEDANITLITTETEYNKKPDGLNAILTWSCECGENTTAFSFFYRHKGCSCKKGPQKKKSTNQVMIRDVECSISFMPYTNPMYELVKERYSLHQLSKELDERCAKIGWNVRATNLHESISESIVAYHYGAVVVKSIRTKKRNAKVSNAFDCLVIKTGERLQVKACGSCKDKDFDCTSFGPNSYWDKLIFVALAGPKYNGSQRKPGDYEVYEISNNYRKFVKLKITKDGQTFAQQASQGRRPRFSLFKTFLIDQTSNKFKIKPKFIGNVYDIGAKRILQKSISCPHLSF